MNTTKPALENLVRRLVSEATNWQLVVFSWWFVTGNKKAEQIVKLMNTTDEPFSHIFHNIKNQKR